MIGHGSQSSTAKAARTLSRIPGGFTSPHALLAVLVLALAGCGGEEKGAEPLGPLGDEGAGSSADPTPGASDAPSAEATKFDDNGHDVIRGTVEATTPEEEAVAGAWFAYWDARVRSFGEVEVDPMMGSVAAGTALSEVVQYVSYLRSNKLHTEGDTKFGVSDIEVRGDAATLSSCGDNNSVDQDSGGRPAEQQTPFYNLEGALKKAGGTWRVVTVEIVGKNGCKA